MSKDSRLFQQIYNNTYPKVFHFIHRLSRKNDALTDDLVQNCYIRLWEMKDTLAESENYLPLLYTIAKGQLIDHYRKVLTEQNKLAQWTAQQSGEPADTTTTILAFKEICGGIDKALSAMPERRRKIYLLCREEGLSHKEIAAQMNISVDSVEQQMNLALKFLRREFHYLRQEEVVVTLMAVLSLAVK